MSSKIPRAQSTLGIKSQTKKDQGGNLKPPQNTQRKNAKVDKEPPVIYGQQAELKNQKPLSSIEELQQYLSESQQRVPKLELQFTDLMKENADIHEHLKDCRVLPVAGKKDQGDAVAQPCENREKEVAGFLAAIGDLAREGDCVMKERESFSLQLLEMEKALKEAQQLLME